MVFATETNERSPIELEPGALVRLPFGVASPLWGFYAGAALTGVAYWWMTQWTRPVNLEALFGRAAALPAMTQAEEAMEAPVDKVVESLVQPELPQAPVGGEAAPIAPSVAVEQADAAPSAAAKEPPPRPAPEPRSVTPKAKAAPEQPRSV